MKRLRETMERDDTVVCPICHSTKVSQLCEYSSTCSEYRCCNCGYEFFSHRDQG